jgi:hypothetical protein
MRFSLRTLIVVIVLLPAVIGMFWRHWMYCDAKSRSLQNEAQDCRRSLEPAIFASWELTELEWQQHQSIEAWKKSERYLGLAQAYDRAKWRPWLLLKIDEAGTLHQVITKPAISTTAIEDDPFAN